MDHGAGARLEHDSRVLGRHPTLHHLRRLGRPHSQHPDRHGGLVGLLAHPASSLVSRAALGAPA